MVKDYIKQQQQEIDELEIQIKETEDEIELSYLKRKVEILKSFKLILNELYFRETDIHNLIEDYILFVNHANESPNLTEYDKGYIKSVQDTIFELSTVVGYPVEYDEEEFDGELYEE